jgi:hypothetical protein
MARKPSGYQLLEKAKELLGNARTAREVRQAQSVMLLLEFNMMYPDDNRHSHLVNYQEGG